MQAHKGRPTVFPHDPERPLTPSRISWIGTCDALPPPQVLSCEKLEESLHLQSLRALHAAVPFLTKYGLNPPQGAAMPPDFCQFGAEALPTGYYQGQPVAENQLSQPNQSMEPQVHHFLLQASADPSFHQQQSQLPVDATGCQQGQAVFRQSHLSADAPPFCHQARTPDLPTALPETAVFPPQSRMPVPSALYQQPSQSIAYQQNQPTEAPLYPYPSQRPAPPVQAMPEGSGFVQTLSSVEEALYRNQRPADPPMYRTNQPSAEAVIYHQPHQPTSDVAVYHHQEGAVYHHANPSLPAAPSHFLHHSPVPQAPTFFQQTHAVEGTPFYRFQTQNGDAHYQGQNEPNAPFIHVQSQPVGAQYHHHHHHQQHHPHLHHHPHHHLQPHHPHQQNQPEASFHPLQSQGPVVARLTSAGLIDGSFFHHRNQGDTQLCPPNQSAEARPFPFQNQTAQEIHQNSGPVSDVPLFSYQGHVPQGGQIQSLAPAELPLISYQNQAAQEAQLRQPNHSDLSVFQYQNQDVQHRQQNHNTVELPIYHYQNQAAQGAQFHQPALIIAKAPIIGFEKDESQKRRHSLGKSQHNSYLKSCDVADSKPYLLKKAVSETICSFGNVANRFPHLSGLVSSASPLSQSAIVSKSQDQDDSAAAVVADAHKENKKSEPNVLPQYEDAVIAGQITNESNSTDQNQEGANAEAQLNSHAVLDTDEKMGEIDTYVDPEVRAATPEEKLEEEPYISHENLLLASIKSPDINMNETEKKNLDNAENNEAMQSSTIGKPHFLDENSPEPFAYYEDIVAAEVNSHEFDIFLDMEPPNGLAEADEQDYYIHRDDEFAAGLYYENSSSPSLSSSDGSELMPRTQSKIEEQEEQQHLPEDNPITVISESSTHILSSPPDILSTLPVNVSCEIDNAAAAESTQPDQNLPRDGSQESVMGLSVLFEEAVNYGLPLTPPATPPSSPPLLTPPCVTPPCCMSQSSSFGPSPHSSASSSPCFSTPPFSSPMSTSPRTEPQAHWELYKAGGVEDESSSRHEEHSSELLTEVCSSTEPHNETSSLERLPEPVAASSLKVNDGVVHDSTSLEVADVPKEQKEISVLLGSTALPSDQPLSTSVSNETSEILPHSSPEQTLLNSVQDVAAAYPFQQLSIQIDLQPHIMVQSPHPLHDHTQSIDQLNASPGLIQVMALDASIECTGTSSVQGEEVLDVEEFVDAVKSSTDHCSSSCSTSPPPCLVPGQELSQQHEVAAAVPANLLSQQQQDAQSPPSETNDSYSPKADCLNP